MTSFVCDNHEADKPREVRQVRDVGMHKSLQIKNCAGAVMQNQSLRPGTLGTAQNRT